jgi:hypothetical protein
MTQNESNIHRVPRRRSARGMWLVVGLFALGGLVLWGFFHARRVMVPTPSVKPSTTQSL